MDRYKIAPELAVDLANRRLAQALGDPRIAPTIRAAVLAGHDVTTLFSIAFRMGYGLALHDVEKGVLGEPGNN